MRLGYVVSMFPKLSETFILREMLELKARGHEVSVFSLKRPAEPRAHPEAADLAAAATYPVYDVRLAAALIHQLERRPLAPALAAGRVAASHAAHPSLLLKGLATIPAALRFARIARARGIEHLHAHWATWPALAAWVMSRLTGIPYSVTGHAHDLYISNPMLGRKLADSRFFATISEHNRALLIQRCGSGALEKVRVIRCGLPLEMFPFSGRPPRSAPATPHVVSIGRLVDYKGFDVLIRACGLLGRAGSPVRCTIVGEGPERPRLERLAREIAPAAAVELAGDRLQHEIPPILSGADLFALACRPGSGGLKDGIPIVLMEAMALGVPVVSTKLSGIPELVSDGVTGTLAIPGDAESLAAAMKRLLDDGGLASRLARHARERIEREYDVRFSVDRLCEALGAGRRTPAEIRR